MAKIDTEVKGFYKEFMDFLNEYKIAGLAIAFIMGVAATSLVKSLVDNIIMPTVTPFIPAEDGKPLQSHLALLYGE